MYRPQNFGYFLGNASMEIWDPWSKEILFKNIWIPGNRTCNSNFNREIDFFFASGSQNQYLDHITENLSVGNR